MHIEGGSETGKLGSRRERERGESTKFVFLNQKGTLFFGLTYFICFLLYNLEINRERERMKEVKSKVLLYLHCMNKIHGVWCMIHTFSPPLD